MPTPFDQLLKDLQAAQGDTERLALVTFDFALQNDPLLKEAAEAVAVPHWFDEKILTALLPEYTDQAKGFLEQLKALPMVESYPTQNREPASNLHEATRLALRKRMLSTDRKRFVQLSKRAANYFGGLAGSLEQNPEATDSHAACQMEAICHRLVSAPDQGILDLASFVKLFVNGERPERLQAIGSLMAELLDSSWQTGLTHLRDRDADAWARTQGTLGYTLADLGTRVGPVVGNQLLEQAVVAYRAALEIYTREELPQDWAGTQNNLAIVHHALGIRSEGQAGMAMLEQAVTALRAALTVRTRENLPMEWATTQNNLAIALQEQGNRSEGLVGLDLLDQAVAILRDALAVFTREDLPQDWAMIQNNLANTFQLQGKRREGPEGLDLLEQAITAYRASLTVRTREAQPEDWAMLQNNLGSALQNQGVRSEGQAGLDLLAQAVTAYRAALEVRTREALPQDWAGTQNNLANTLRHQGIRSEWQAGHELLRQSVATYRAALTVYTREALPQQWAMTQNNLGNALTAEGDRAMVAKERQQLYREAEAAYLAALEVHTLGALSFDHRQTQGNLERVQGKMAK